MSNSSLSDPRTVLPDQAERTVFRGLYRSVRRLGFWAAVGLPFLHIPLLATGLESSTALQAFLVLVVLNVVALVVGRPHQVN
ncbi:MAG: hypothetical protein V5A43_00250 [Haloarculaceae archaeon]